ncbi:cob(I)yrinic acid a,c-diamide adenosyltransferase [Vallitalea okinawensis]|uniref:cob(I)yrinic acid a,c-diamide adenosyltransferase n=1 Tax=Vallitalea okinawensis TaxID=2078660 RepID=UPI000CFD91A6|nr:cob(I)yrinic acid a,c-diamide adenosyltransferase [Vallitalea okinawensis]
MDKGLIQVYCGKGKGKTTAAIGQGVRAVGHGYKVIMIQFLKGNPTGEMESLKNLEPHFKLFRFEKERDFFWNLTDEEKKDLSEDIKNGLNFARKVLDTRQCDVLILDEILGVIRNEIVPMDEVIDILDNKPAEIEVVLTGREVPEEIYQRANYVSTIEDTKHPFEEGIGARKGIEY